VRLEQDARHRALFGAGSAPPELPVYRHTRVGSVMPTDGRGSGCTRKGGLPNVAAYYRPTEPTSTICNYTSIGCIIDIQDVSPRFRYIVHQASGITFHFTFERNDPCGRLHIEVAHSAQPEDAIRTFFNPFASSYWDAEHTRWERWAAGWLVSFLWMDEPVRRNVLVLTCLYREEGA
jgi:hypothetical protein